MNYLLSIRLSNGIYEPHKQLYFGIAMLHFYGTKISNFFYVTMLTQDTTLPILNVQCICHTRHSKYLPTVVNAPHRCVKFSSPSNPPNLHFLKSTPYPVLCQSNFSQYPALSFIKVVSMSKAPFNPLLVTKVSPRVSQTQRGMLRNWVNLR